MSSAILKWLGGNDTGSSSKALALAALGEMPQRPNHPHDTVDFGRCHRLLQAASEARVGLDKLAAEGGPYWAALAARWDEITAAYLDETEAGRSKAYDLMRSILRPIEDADRRFVRLSPGVSMRFGG